MGRYPEAPFDFQCPYEHNCPHLDGISAMWARCLIADLQRDEFRDGHFAREAEAEIAALQADVERLKKDNADLRVRLKADGTVCSFASMTRTTFLSKWSLPYRCTQCLTVQDPLIPYARPASKALRNRPSSKALTNCNLNASLYRITGCITPLH
jgi:hypothetical protein